ncbi:MAG TPA: DNA gyrase C-terminal beta-propeller domain-containing protein, partial [Sumerlaeia bacterium]|nr:DNA gyrase C-terminal beta-propeller domain-containing protein [Sumerlaeia bacterium]
NDDLMVMTAAGQTIRMPVKDIRVIGRATQGVRLMRIEADGEITDVARIMSEEEEARKPRTLKDADAEASADETSEDEDEGPADEASEDEASDDEAAEEETEGDDEEEEASDEDDTEDDEGTEDE